MTPSETIALWAVIVAGLSAVVTGLSVWTSYRLATKRLRQDAELQVARLEHEARLQDARLTHERTEAVRTQAAEAYSAAAGAIDKLDSSFLLAVRGSDPSWADRDERESLARAAEAVALLATIGWDDRVRRCAADLAATVRVLAGGGGVAYLRVRRQRRTKGDDVVDATVQEALDRLEERRSSAVEALAAYRSAVAGEDEAKRRSFIEDI